MVDYEAKLEIYENQNPNKLVLSGDIPDLNREPRCITEMYKSIQREREKTTLDPVAFRAEEDWAYLQNKVVGHER